MMLVLRTQGATIRPVVPRLKHSIAFAVHQSILFRALVQKKKLNYFYPFEMIKSIVDSQYVGSAYRMRSLAV